MTCQAKILKPVNKNLLLGWTEKLLVTVGFFWRAGIKENAASQHRHRNIKVLNCLLEALVVTLFNGPLSCFKGALTSLPPFLF